MNALATTLREEGHLAEQEKLERETLAIRLRVLGPSIRLPRVQCRPWRTL